MGSATNPEQPNGPDRPNPPDRRARIAELRAAEQRHARRGKLIALWVAGVVLAALVGGGVVLMRNPEGDPIPGSATTPGSGAIAGVRTWEHLSRNHVPGTVTYPQTPPVGGDHNPVWLDCTGKVYDKPVRDENAVHSMEHGAVWVTYNAQATPADIKALADRVGTTPYSFMSPHPGQPGTITLSAWGTQLVLDSASDPRVERFFTTYVQGPQTQEPGASCSAGSMPLTNG
ncbi:DUF3105 domain-containing protein [Kitasatospora sp. NPDC004240]